MLETIDQEDSDKLERPRSEGHRYMKQFSPKRTSSYGVRDIRILLCCIIHLK
jgi:hypothetical protein